MHGSGGWQTEDQGDCTVEPAENHKGLLKVNLRKNSPKKLRLETVLIFRQIQCVGI